MAGSDGATGTGRSRAGSRSSTAPIAGEQRVLDAERESPRSRRPVGEWCFTQ